MKSKLGILCVILGLGLLAGSLALYLHNGQEAEAAEQTVTAVVPQVLQQIPETPPPEAAALRVTPVEFLDPADLEMKETEVDGYTYIGVLSIPKLGLELPVMAGWDYVRLKVAPCRYRGTVLGNDLVLMAHNYRSHFGRIDQLVHGDTVCFTDMNGIATVYSVVGRDVLAPDAVEEMTAGHFDLTLFTCTYGGQSRVTVYCDRAE